MPRACAVVVAIVLAAILAPVAVAQAPTETLGVLGHGEIEATPNIGSFDAQVVRTSPTSVGARTRANGRLRAIVASLTALGVPRSSITTTSVTLRRTRTRLRSNGPLRVRYVAAGAFAVRVEGLDKLGKALDSVAAAGATNIDGPDYDFASAQKTQARAAAEQAALTDARTRADLAAGSQGQHVVGVQSIELDPSSPTPVGAVQDYSGAAPSPAQSKTAVPAPILPGTETFSSTVRVVYTLAPGA